ncbi:glycosyltransferase family 4 protein [Anaerorhabdus sp.]|uniref:glycosyltransferase family 4 protein n=1 Tax=Anaerorhabdus sp. TaxID=1872524 RepID=UPI002FCAAC4E
MKILYVTTILGTMSFFKAEFEHLIKNKHVVHLACNCSVNESFNVSKYDVEVFDIPFSRTPFSLDNLKACIQIRELVDKNKYDIIHCHTPNASVITRFASRKSKKNGTKIIYTVHGFHFYKGAPLKNWLLYYPAELICSYWTSTLITINREDFEFAQKFIKAKNIKYVPGVGIDLNKFSIKKNSPVSKREELSIPLNSIMLLSIGELNDNKNHETVIKAIKDMDVYYVIAGIGQKSEYLLNLTKKYGIDNKVKLIGFRNDVPDLLQSADIFVFASFREGLSVSLMETMAAGKAVVASKIRGNVDLIDDKGGFLFNPKNVEECRNAINQAIISDRNILGKYNQEKVKKFSIESIIRMIDEIYEVL